MTRMPKFTCKARAATAMNKFSISLINAKIYVTIY